MKILYIDHSPSVGGATKVMMNLLNMLDQHKVTPIIACANGSMIKNPLIQMGFKVKTLHMPWLTKNATFSKHIFYIFSYLLTSFLLSRLILREKIEIIHANTFISCLYCIIPVLITRKPLIWHMHDILEVNRFYKFFIKLSEFASVRIICVSAAVKKGLMEFDVDADKCTVIYNSIRETKKNPIKNKFKKEFNIDEKTRLVGLIGIITGWKGQHILIEAIPAVLKEFPDTKFIIAGDTIRETDHEYKNNLLCLVAKNGINKNTIFTGYREDIPEVIEDLDLVVHTSISPDPLPTVILEAMANGKAVIATNIGGCPEIIANMINGILVPPDNPEALACAITTLLENPDLRTRLSKEGYKSLKKFTPEENLHKTMVVYNSTQHM